MSYKIFTEKQRLKIIQKFQNYTGTKIEFCKLHQINRKTLYKWIRNLAEKNNSKFINLNYTANHDESMSAQTNTDLITIFSSPIKISIKNISIDFSNGCKLQELQTILELINVTK